MGIKLNRDTRQCPQGQRNPHPDSYPYSHLKARNSVCLPEPLSEAFPLRHWNILYEQAGTLVVVLSPQDIHECGSLTMKSSLQSGNLVGNAKISSPFKRVRILIGTSLRELF